MLYHRDDSRDRAFRMLLDLYGFSLLAQRTGRQDKSEELEGSWRSADNRQGLDLGFDPRPRRGTSATRPCAGNSSTSHFLQRKILRPSLLFPPQHCLEKPHSKVPARIDPGVPEEPCNDKPTCVSPGTSLSKPGNAEEMSSPSRRVPGDEDH